MVASKAAGSVHGQSGQREHDHQPSLIQAKRHKACVHELASSAGVNIQQDGPERRRKKRKKRN